MSELTAYDRLRKEHKAFLNAYLSNKMNEFKAYQTAYSSKVRTEGATRAAASRLLNSVNMQKALKEKTAKIEERATITQLDVLNELITWATVDTTLALNNNGTVKKISDLPKEVRQAIQDITVTETKQGPVYRLKFVDKRGSMELIGRHFAMFTDKLKLDGHLTHDDYTNLDVEQIRERRIALEEALLKARKTKKN